MVVFCHGILLLSLIFPPVHVHDRSYDPDFFNPTPRSFSCCLATRHSSLITRRPGFPVTCCTAIYSRPAVSVTVSSHTCFQWLFGLPSLQSVKHLCTYAFHGSAIDARRVSSSPRLLYTILPPSGMPCWWYGRVRSPTYICFGMAQIDRCCSVQTGLYFAQLPVDTAHFRIPS